MRLKTHKDHVDVILSSLLCPSVTTVADSVLGTETNAVVNTGVWVTFDKSFISFGDTPEDKMATS